MFSSIRNQSYQRCIRAFHQKKWIFRSSSALSRALKYNVGDKISGYTVQQIEEVPELNLAAVRLEHKETGADHLHIAREDNNNCFSVSLRTIVQNNAGIPHILEHLSLCGSKNYPCRDPFFKMMNRSLSTFMNAFTGNDCTMYPFSTQNPKDFENLLRVYLDAVFFPNLSESDFRQEGWRLEHEDINNRESPIIFKGVVFNEMKGIFSDPNQHYARRLLNELYPGHTYSFECGGDPLHIPELTRDELVKFHSRHYHPSNSRFLTYGNMPLENHLEIIENYALKKFNKITVENSIPNEKLWTEPREVFMHSRFDPLAAAPDKQATVSVSYLLNSVADTYETSALSIISSLLVDGPNAPFYRSLLEPGIGPDFSPYVGYDGHQKQGFFSIGLREIHENDVQQVKDIIDATFDEVIKTGFPEERIKAILHSVELGTKHQTSNFGLSCVMGVNSTWIHEGNPATSLKVNDHVKWFVTQMNKNPHFIQDKIAQYFKDNTHKLTLIMTPKETFEKEKQEKEQQLLEKKVSKLSDEDRLRTYNEGIELAKLQEKEQDVSCLPCLKIDDVQRNIERTNIQIASIGKVTVQLCAQPTNEVVYFKAIANASSLPEDLLMLLPVFCNVVTKMGAGDRTYKEFDQEAELKTGGLSTSVHLTEHPEEKSFEKGIAFSSYCLERNVDDMFSLWKDVFNRIRLDDLDRLSHLIRMAASDLAQSIAHMGHTYSMRKSCASLTACANIREKMAGLDQVSFMKKLAELNNFEETAAKLKKISEIMLNKNSLRCSINASPSATTPVRKSLESFLGSISEGKSFLAFSNEENTDLSISQKTHFILPFSVNYLGRGIPTVPYGHNDFASLKTAAKLMSTKFLHREIREKGGAYGGGSTITDGGHFLFYSYRDPNMQKTLDCFDSGVQWLLQGNFSDQDVEEAKLGIFSEIDRPIPPGSKGTALFLNKISDEMKALLRDRLFALSKDGIVSATKRYLSKPSHSGVALIGPENDATNTFDWIKHKE